MRRRSVVILTEVQAAIRDMARESTQARLQRPKGSTARRASMIRIRSAKNAALSSTSPRSRLLTAYRQPDDYAMLVESIVTNPMRNGETIRLAGAIRMAPK
jgi:G:T/U-mismatch repair DNA glycosylase